MQATLYSAAIKLNTLLFFFGYDVFFSIFMTKSTSRGMDTFRGDNSQNSLSCWYGSTPEVILIPCGEQIRTF